MQFHLPKPLHGWREFAGEVGIIVVGVLIALGAEQVVETVHWRDEVAAERKSLLFEANDGLSAVAARQVQQPCVDRRLQDIRLVLERHHRKEPLELVRDIGRPASQVAARGTWQIALTGQALSHMSDKEKLAFSDSFANLELWERISIEEKAIWLRLAPLNLPDLLSEEDWSGIRSAYADAVIYNDHIRVLAPWMQEQVRRDLPQVQNPRPAENLAAFNGMTGEICKPILARFARAGKAS
jgi:hypothetical protein